MLLGVKGRKERLMRRTITYILRSQIKAFIVSSIDIIITGEGWTTTHINREQNFSEIGRFFGEKSEIGRPGKETAVEKSNGKKSAKNREKSAKNRRKIGKERFC